MAVQMVLEWDGVTPDQYDEVKRVVNWEGEVPPGAVLHTTAFSEGRMRVVDVWESGDAFQTFVQTRLMPGVQQVGVQGEPRVEILPLHDLFTPGV